MNLKYLTRSIGLLVIGCAIFCSVQAGDAPVPSSKKEVQGLTLEQAQAELKKLWPQLQEAYGRVANAPQVRETAIAAVSASQKYEQTVMAHEKIAPFKAKLNAATKELTEAIKANGFEHESIDPLREKLVEARAALFEKAETIPELARIKKGADMIQQIHLQNRDQQLKELDPASAELLAKRDALEARIKALSE